MALDPGVRAILYSRALGEITFSGGNWDVVNRTRYLRADLDPAGERSYVEYLNVTRQAYRDWAAGRAFQTGHGTLLDQGHVPTDPTIGIDPVTHAADTPYRARVLVTVTQPDGSAASTLVVVDSNGVETAGQLAARGVNQAQNDVGTVHSPPTFSRRAAGQPVWTAQIITVGRAGGV